MHQISIVCKDQSYIIMFVRAWKYAVLLVLMAFSLPMHAQEMITGYVIDDQTGDSIGFITVQY